MKTQSLEKARDLARKTREWIATPEGQKELQNAVERASKVTTELGQLRRVDPEKLHEPFTV